MPGAVLVNFDDLGHSVLETHALAALHVAQVVAGGGLRRLPDLAPAPNLLPTSVQSRPTRACSSGDHSR